ncbi:MAG: exosortase-associated EpsI family protein [Planctomycetaceae bacterium]
MGSRSLLITAAAAVLLIAGVTATQGLLTGRWGEKKNELLGLYSSRLERLFPESFGQWSMERSLDVSRAELDRAGAVGSVSRIYRNHKTRASLSAFVVCATPHDASGHTPDRCYPGAGFEIAEPEHRETLTLSDGRSAEAFTGTFAKEGQTIRVFWTYGVSERARPAEAAGAEAPRADAPAGAADVESLTWMAPQIARIRLNEYPAVYKLYAIVDQTKLAPSRATAECSNFISELLPAFEAAIVADVTGVKPAAAPTPAPTPAADTGDAAG